MTDAEIRQSKVDHAHQREEIERIVRHNTPSRRGLERLPNGRWFIHFYDWREIRLEPRRR